MHILNSILMVNNTEVFRHHIPLKAATKSLAYSETSVQAKDIAWVCYFWEQSFTRGYAPIE